MIWDLSTQRVHNMSRTFPPRADDLLSIQFLLFGLTWIGALQGLNFDTVVSLMRDV